MILDVHTHLLFDDTINESAEALLRSMDGASIDKALVFAGKHDPLANQRTLEAIKRNRDRLVGIGSVSPITAPPPVAQIGEWLANGLITGLKFYTGYEAYYPDDERLRPYLELLQQFGKPAIFHCGDTYREARGARLKYAHPLAIDDLASDLPELKIVIAHVGFPWVVDTAAVCLKNPNVFTDLSGFVYGAFQSADKQSFADILDRFQQTVGGQDKFLFGTDWPICDQKSYVETLREVAPDLLKSVFEVNAKYVFG